MKRTALLSVTFILAMVLPAVARSDAADVQTRESLTRVRDQIPAMAASFGWTGEVPVREGGTLDATAERISLNPEEIAGLVAGLPKADREDGIRLIVAHEVWHFVELNRNPAAISLSRSDGRRAFECRADLMAGRFLSSQPESERPNPRYSRPGYLAEAIWKAESPDHPKPVQRSRAAHFGALTVLRENRALPASQLEEVNQSLDYAAKDTLSEWMKSACDRIVHAGGDALGSVVTNSATLRPRGDDTVLTIVYANASQRHVEVSTLLSATWFRKGTAPGLTEFRRYLPLVFTLLPGEKRSIEGILTGTGGVNENVFLDYSPTDNDTLIKAKFVTGPVRQSPSIETAELAEDDIKFAGVVQSLANDAPTSFSQYRGSGGSLHGTAIALPSLVRLPGFPARLDPTIWRNNNNSSSFTQTLYVGLDAKEAERVYTAVLTKLKRIWPQSIEPETRGPYGREFSAYVTKYSRINVSLSRPVDIYSVRFEMVPNVLGFRGE